LIVKACNAELTQFVTEPYVQSEQTIQQFAAEQDLQEPLFLLLDNWIGITG